MSGKDPLKNPMRFSLGNRTVDIGRFDVDVTEIDIRVSEGQIYVHWDSDTDRGESP